MNSVRNQAKKGTWVYINKHTILDSKYELIQVVSSTPTRYVWV